MLGRLEPGQGMPCGLDHDGYEQCDDGIAEAIHDDPHCLNCGEDVMDGEDYCPACWAFDQMYGPGQGDNPYRVAKQMSEITGKPLSECLDIVWPEAWHAMHIRIDDICCEINKLKEALQ